MYIYIMCVIGRRIFAICTYVCMCVCVYIYNLEVLKATGKTRSSNIDFPTFSQLSSCTVDT